MFNSLRAAYEFVLLKGGPISDWKVRIAHNDGSQSALRFDERFKTNHQLGSRWKQVEEIDWEAFDKELSL